MKSINKSKEELIRELEELKLSYSSLLEKYIEDEQKPQIELDLKKSDALYRSILHASPDVITITDLTGKILFTSPKVTEMFGLKNSEDSDNLSLFEFISEKDHARATENLTRMFHGENVIAQEYTGQRLDGSTFDIEVNGEFIKDKEGSPTGMIFVTRDITERKRTEARMMKNEENFRFLIENINDAIYEISIDGTIIYVSPSIEKILGFKPDELIGDNFFRYMFPEDKPLIMLALSALGQFDNSNLEYRYITKDGRLRWVRSSTAPIYKDGAIVGGTGSLTDINDRKIAEDELRKLSRAVQQSPVSIVITNLDGNIEYANPKACQTTGYELSELLGKNPRVLKSGETAMDEYSKLWNSISNGNQWHGIFHNKRKDGTFYWESSVITPILDQGGNITHYLAVKEDITERIKTEEALVKSEQRFSQLARQSQTVIWEVDSMGLYTYVNEMSERVWGYAPEEMIGKMYFYELHAEDNRLDYKDKVLASFASKVEFKNILNQIVTKNGKLIWVLTNGIPILDKNGNLIGYRGADNDVTEEKLKDKELKKLSLAVHQSPVSIVITDLIGNIEYVNPAFEETTGYTAQEVIGQSTRILKSGQTSNELYKKMWDTITSGNEWQSEWVNKKKDGELFWENILIAPIYNENNQISNYLAIKQDITSRKLAETEIRDLNFNLEKRISERTMQLADTNNNLLKEIEERKILENDLRKARIDADQANLAKSEFLSRMSHELRTPMNSILGFAQLLELGELNPRQKKGVNHIMKSGKHLLDLINEVLDISRIEAGRLSLSIEPVKLIDIAHETIDIVRLQAQQMQLTINLTDSQFLNLFVLSDRQRLKQVLLNLINNAIKYNKPGGIVELKAEPGTVNTNETKTIRISVTDSGLGIAEKDLSRLFVPFERVGAEKTETEGTGLGLAVVKKLIDAMGGTCGVESTPGVGSSFWIELPQVDSPLDQMKKSGNLIFSESDHKDQLSTILYIEDNLSNIELVEQILDNQRAKIRLITQKSGKKVFECIASIRPDLVLLDLNLPDLDGESILRQLQSDQQTREIPIVILSADAMPGTMARLLRMGAKNYLTKPLDLMNFLQIIDMNLRK